MEIFLLRLLLTAIVVSVVVSSLMTTEGTHEETDEDKKANEDHYCFAQAEKNRYRPTPLQKEGQRCYLTYQTFDIGDKVLYEEEICPCDAGLQCVEDDEASEDTEPDGICVSSLDSPLSDTTSLPTVSVSTDTTLTADISIPTDLPSVTAPINVDLSTVPGLPDATTVLSNDSNLLPSVNKETGDALQLNNKEMKSNKGMLCFDSQKPTELPNLNGDKDEIIDQSQEDQMDELMKYALKIMSEDTSDYKCDANALEKWMQLM